MKNDKRGQVTLYILITILIVAVVLTVVLVSRNSDIVKFNSETDLSSFRVYVNEVLNEKNIFLLSQIGQNGGYLQKAPMSIKIDERNFTYLYFSGSNYFLDFDKVEEGIKDYYLSYSDELNQEISKKFKNVDVKITNVNVSSSNLTKMDIAYTWFSGEGDEMHSGEEKYSKSYNFSLNTTLMGVRKIISHYSSGNWDIPPTVLEGYGLDAETIIYSDTILLYKVIDRDSDFNGDKFKIYFAVKK